MPTRLLRACLLLLATACASASGTPGAALAGDYTVESVNDRPLPARLREYPSGHSELVSGGLTLRADGTFLETGAVRLITGGVANTNTQTATGTYTVDGSRLTLRYERDGRTVTGAVDGGKLLVEASGDLKVRYRRQ